MTATFHLIPQFDSNTSPHPYILKATIYLIWTAGQQPLTSSQQLDSITPQEVYKKVLHLDPRIKEEELKKVFGIQVVPHPNHTQLTITVSAQTKPAPLAVH